MMYLSENIQHCDIEICYFRNKKYYTQINCFKKYNDYFCPAFEIFFTYLSKMILWTNKT